eukprot:sb/3472893/
MNEYIHLETNKQWRRDPYHEKRAIRTHAKEIERFMEKLNLHRTNLDTTSPIAINLILDKNQEELPKITVYTDGSKIEKEDSQKVGAGVIIYYPDSTKTLMKPLAPENTINQAELMAIEMTADEITNNYNAEDRHEITIHTDSQTTITKLFGKWSTSKQL